MKHKKRYLSYFLFSVAAVVLSSFLTIQISAQTGTSAVAGTVQDPQGNVVANTAARLINDEKDFSSARRWSEPERFKLQLRAA
jgi:hypothetical protein